MSDGSNASTRDGTPLPSHADQPTSNDVARNSTFGTFELKAIVGYGAFGVVWEAYDTLLQRRVAIKRPRRKNTGIAPFNDFLIEARAIAMLRHSHIVSVFEIGDVDGEPFIVMDFIEGSNLREALNVRPTLPPIEAVAMVLSLTSAIEHAHANGLIHKDLKPSNVLIDRHNTPFVVDFGLASHGLRPDGSDMEGRIVGTLLYMAPEQAQGQLSQVGERTDVYALGAILYELLGGRPPFRGNSDELLRSICQSEPSPLRSINRALPSELDAICLKCLAKEPEARYQSARALREDLEAFQTHRPLRGVTSNPITRSTKWLRRNRRDFLITSSAITISGTLWYADQKLHRGDPRGGREGDLDAFPDAEITTTPEGARISVVRLNDHTGEPDPNTFQRLGDASPVRARLEPGNYLVIAHHHSSGQWHEVVRRVPTVGEIPAVAEHRRFRFGEDVIRLHEITLPPVSVATGMITMLLSSPKEGGSRQFAMLVDAQRAGDAHSPASTTPTISGITRLQDGVLVAGFHNAMRLAEREGKRLPTLAELQLLYTAAPKHQHPPLSASPNRRVWSSSRPAALGNLQNTGISGISGDASRVTVVTGEDHSHLEHVAVLEEIAPASMRFVRSTLPRESRDDFWLPPVIAHIRGYR